MVGGTKYRLEDVLTEKQVHQVVKKCVNEDQWEVVESNVRPASEGLSGFVGEHFKATLQVKVAGRLETIPLFIKRVPPGNKPKADFINEHSFFKRESMVFQLFEEIAPDEGPNPFSIRALICNESILVLPDLSVRGYAPRHHTDTFDLPHALVAAAAAARFHAAIANHRTARPALPYTDITESTFQPGSPWLRAAAKLTADFLDAFSTEHAGRISRLEEKLYEKYLEACASLREYEDTLNVIVHKDLWANNIMFRYENGSPANALLIDYQCIRHGPPAFDVMMLLYLTTSREFREEHEKKIMHHYYCVFSDALDEATKLRMRGLGYDREEFLQWCERSRMMGMVLALGIFPFTMMEPVLAQRTFDNAATFDRLMDEDRSGPVVAHARDAPVYKMRQLQLAEEFVERYIVEP